MKPLSCLLALCLLASTQALAFQLNPDGSISPDGPTTMAPDGTFHSGTDTQMNPNGTFRGTYGNDRGGVMNPNGSFSSGDQSWMRPDGGYSSNSTSTYEVTPYGKRW